MTTRTTAGSLPLRPLGRTDMRISPVGFGAWAAGGTAASFNWGPQDDGDTIAAIHRAVERGVNWIDTAPVYGLGHSEEVVGAALKSLPGDLRPLVFTKCGIVWEPGSSETRRSGLADSLRREVDASLTRLGVERIDLYQMHWPAEDAPLEDYWRTLSDLRAEGKVRAVGLSNHSVEQLERAEAIGHVDTLQPPFSAVRRDLAAQQLPWCREHGTGIIVYSPMQAGLLTGRFSAERAASLPESDWRRRNPQFTGDALVRNLALAEALKPIAEAYGVSPAAVAVAWVLAWPGISGAIVGARSPEQVDGWIGGATLALSAADLDAIAAAIARTGAGSGPARP